MIIYPFDFYAFGLMFSTFGALFYSYRKGYITFREKNQNEFLRLNLLGVFLIIAGFVLIYYVIIPGIFLSIFGLLYVVFTQKKSILSVAAAAITVFLVAVPLLLVSFTIVVTPFLKTDIITGDEQAIGARIYVDGKEIGIMEKWHAKDGDFHSSGKTRLPPMGEFRIEFVRPDGKRLKKKITQQGDIYLHVDFKKMKIYD